MWARPGAPSACATGWPGSSGGSAARRASLPPTTPPRPDAALVPAIPDPPPHGRPLPQPALGQRGGTDRGRRRTRPSRRQARRAGLRATGGPGRAFSRRPRPRCVCGASARKGGPGARCRGSPGLACSRPASPGFSPRRRRRPAHLSGLRRRLREVERGRHRQPGVLPPGRGFGDGRTAAAVIDRTACAMLPCRRGRRPGRPVHLMSAGRSVPDARSAQNYLTKHTGAAYYRPTGTCRDSPLDSNVGACCDTGST